MLIFFIGMAEAVLSTLWAKSIQETRMYWSPVITMMNVLIWYYVLRTVLEQVNDVSVVLMYALGCGLGNFLVIMTGKVMEKRAAHKSRIKKEIVTGGSHLAMPVPAMPTLITIE